MSKKPGVMIYFEIKESVDRLSDKNAGILLRAILQYGATGTVPELPNQLYLIWPMIRMRLENDDARYHQLHYKRRYAAHVRWCNGRGMEALPYAQWLESEEGSVDPLPC